MEIFTNRIIGFLLKLFLMSLAMDIVSRVYFDEDTNKVKKSTTIPESENVQTVVNTPEKNIPLLDPLNEVEATYLGSENQLINLDIFICSSCGYKKHFDELRLFLESKFPNLRVLMKEYPVKKSKIFLSKFIMILQFTIIALLFLGEKIFQKLNMPVPALYYKIVQYKMFVIFAVYMLGNNLSSMLSSSGAFEIVFNNEVLFSKIKEGSFPKPESIYHMLKNQFN